MVDKKIRYAIIVVAKNQYIENQIVILYNRVYYDRITPKPRGNVTPVESWNTLCKTKGLSKPITGGYILKGSQGTDNT